MTLQRTFSRGIQITSVINNLPSQLSLATKDKIFIPRPICHMSLTASLELAIGVGVATFTRTSIGTYIDRATGLLKNASANIPRFEQEGVLLEGAATNLALQNRDFANVAHTKTNITAVKNAVGLDGVVNSASTLTATAANGTVFQGITLSSAARTFSIDVRRKTGTGKIEVTDDGGSNYTDVTAMLSTTKYKRFQITTSQSNPSLGLRITTSGDEVEVDYEGIETGAVASSRIATLAATVTRTAEFLNIDEANIPVPTANYSIHAVVTTKGGYNTSSHAYLSVGGESWRVQRIHDASGKKPGVFHGSDGNSAIIDGGPVTTPDINNRFTTVFDGVGAEFFREGISQDRLTTFAATTGTTDEIQIGRQDPASFLYGHIRELKIFDVALTQAQITALVMNR